MKRDVLRRRVLFSLGAGAAEAEELLAYNINRFALPAKAVTLPLPDEPFVAAWKSYLTEGRQKGMFACLRNRLVQLQFPVREGVSQTTAYRQATRKGLPTSAMPEATGLTLKDLEGVHLALHSTAAGHIPVLTVSEREDFVALVRALSMRNEPCPVPDSMGAAMVAGLNNWDRIRSLKEKWQETHPQDKAGQGWREAFRRIIPQKELYQDRLILLSNGPYSDVPAQELGLKPDEWRRRSLLIRREHECTHYFTRRVFGIMQDRLLDELLADFMGIVAANGTFRSDWFLRFMGLEHFPDYRVGGRLENYRGQPPLSTKAFRVLQKLVRQAAINLEHFTTPSLQGPKNIEKSTLLTGLAQMTLEELGSSEAETMFHKALENTF
ncbi:MAG: hypothetical protein JRJ04_14555 [Deltaproteobacteria bacterium]|nr:hypothetical protein [Deltaproteobacteria bacterium]